jgi:hypothetical protein
MFVHRYAIDAHVDICVSKGMEKDTGSLCVVHRSMLVQHAGVSFWLQIVAFWKL